MAKSDGGRGANSDPAGGRCNYGSRACACPRAAGEDAALKGSVLCSAAYLLSGFTFAGFAEPFGILLTILLLFVTPLGTVDFWLTLEALAGLIAVQAVYWLFTHPVNKFWLQDEKLSRAGSGFFSFAADASQSWPVSWTELRDRWEYSHVARAVLAFASFSALAIAISS